MKAKVYNLKGEKKAEINLPEFFGNEVREDIVVKYFEVDKYSQPYSNDPKGGKKHSAAGKISHKRHDWKGHYGRGISRIPRKVMWRRGTQFFWIGAEISSVRGGRRAHPPKGIGKEKKINKKEIKLAMDSGFAASVNEKYVLRRYESLDKLNFEVPIIIESNLDNVKSKEIFAFIKNLLGDNYPIALRSKSVRAGKGKRRGRKYKSNAGALFVKGREEKFKIQGVDLKSVDEVSIGDFYPLGRLTIYTERAIQELGGNKK